MCPSVGRCSSSAKSDQHSGTEPEDDEDAEEDEDEPAPRSKAKGKGKGKKRRTSRAGQLRRCTACCHHVCSDSSLLTEPEEDGEREVLEEPQQRPRPAGDTVTEEDVEDYEQKVKHYEAAASVQFHPSQACPARMLAAHLASPCTAPAVKRQQACSVSEVAYGWQQPLCFTAFIARADRQPGARAPELNSACRAGG